MRTKSKLVWVIFLMLSSHAFAYEHSTPTVMPTDTLPKPPLSVGPVQSQNPVTKRLGFVALGLLGGVLAYATAVLTFGILYGGVGAGLILLPVAFFFLAGGFFFLFKAFRKQYKPYKQMTRSERKKEWRGFLYTWLATTVAFVLVVLSQVSR
jgi:hypothetical protein